MSNETPRPKIGPTDPTVPAPPRQRETAPPGAGLRETRPSSEGDLAATRDLEQTVDRAENLQATSDSTPAAVTDAGTAGPSSTPSEGASLKDFRLLKKLGEGGMGTVYKAHQVSLDRVVAVKVPFKHLTKDEAFVQRFYREARVMAKLDHPNILRCYSVGEENGCHYLAMEFIDGSSMQSWLQQLGKLSVGDALYVILACGQALQHAHEQNLIHRDIKPDNILVTSKGVVKVADMGLAKALTDDLGLSRTGTGAGTPYYMSPEQARDAKHVDGRSDIYALGTMLYCFLTGNPPFKGETYVELLLAKEQGKFTPARRSNPEIPERLDLIIDKMMAVKPEHRYTSCAQLVHDLTALALVHEALSFIPGATAPAASKTSRPSAAAATPRPAATATQRSASPKLAPATPATSELWFLSVQTAAGKPLKRKMTTAQIRDMIKDKDFDLDAKVSRTLKGPYKHLGAYKEFEAVLTARMVKAKAERKTAQLQDAYKTILKEEKSYYRWRSIRNLFRTFTGWVTLGIWLAVLAGLGFVLYLYAGALWGYVADLLHLRGS
jgi:serine/threonine-protein kinase